MKQRSKNSSSFGSGGHGNGQGKSRGKGRGSDNSPRNHKQEARPPKRGIKAGTRAGRMLAEAKESNRETPRESRRPDPRPEKRQNNNVVKPRATLFGLHAVEAAILNPTRHMHAIYCTDSTENTAYEWVERARLNGIKRPEPILLEKQAFDRLLPKDTVHQGIGMDAVPLSEVFLPDILNITVHKEKSVILLLDQVTDPHNMGAILRSACAFGADAVVVQSRHAPELNGIVAKTACGAVEHLAVVYETNLARSIQTLQEHGYFALALDERGEKTIREAPHYDKTVLVLGAEGAGLRPLIRDKCDVLVKLPTSGALSSLNVSNAAAVALYAVCE
jgi:23S rRNA (guanosine2251-2'-O)-methyltransferase